MMMLHILKFHINGKHKNLNFPVVKKFINCTFFAAKKTFSGNL